MNYTFYRMDAWQRMIITIYSSARLARLVWNELRGIGGSGYRAAPGDVMELNYKLTIHFDGKHRRDFRIMNMAQNEDVIVATLLNPQHCLKVVEE